MDVPLPTEQPVMLLWSDDEATPCVAPLFGVRTRHTAYRMAREGKFPVETLQVGSRLVCRTVDVRRVLGMDEPAAASA